MELLTLPMFISLAALFISAPLIFIISRKRHESSVASSMLPPGTTGWPIIRENLEFMKEKFVKDRMERFSSQVFKTSVLGEYVAVLCGPAGNKCLFSNEDKLVTGWFPPQIDIIFPSSTQSSGNEEGKKLRKLLPGFLKAEALQRYIGIMDSMAKQHLEASWENEKEVYVLPLAKSFTFALGCRLFVSIDDPIQLAKFAEPFTALTTSYLSLPINLPGTPFNRAVKASNVLRKYLVEIIKQRKIELAEGKASPTQDILSHMLCTSDIDGQFMEVAGIADKILGLLVGGHTASAVITFFVKYLAEYPHVYNQVFKEQREILQNKPPDEPLNWEHIQKMRYSWNVACEVLRLASPIQGTFREALTDFTFAGFSIPKGWKLYWSTNSTHRDANYFPDPEKFDPSRFEGNGPAPYTYVPFGGGPRMCPGKEYARLEMLVFMHNLVTKFKWDKKFLYEKIVFNTMPIPAKGLPIRLQPHIC